MPTKPFRLKADYAKPYQPFDPSCLHKDDFLRDARRLLRQTAKALEAAGLTTLKIYTTRGGPAVSGELIGYFALDETQGLEVFIGASGVGRARSDHITIMARVSAYTLEARGKKQVVRIGRMGTNVWLDADINSRQLARKLMDVARGRGYHLESLVWDPQGNPDPALAYGGEVALGHPAPPPPKQLSLFETAGP